MPIGGEIAIGDKPMTMRVEIGPISSESLKGKDAAWADVRAAEQRLKSFHYRSIGGLGQQTQQRAFALKQAAQDPRDGKGPVTVWNGSQDLGCEFFGKEGGALRLAAGAEIPCPARVRQKVLLAAFVAANAREASLEPSTGKKLLHRAHNHRTQRPRLRLKALFVSADIAVEVILKQLIKSGAFGMSRTILRWWFSNAAAGVLIREIIWLDWEGAKDDRLMPEGHVGQ